MALVRPVLNSIPAFDAANGSVFTFTSSGNSSQITGNRLIIKRNDTLATVYDRTQTTYSYTHTVPANVLTNGVNYVATIITLSGSQQSPESRGVSFYCFATPTFQFSNISSGAVINSNSYHFDLVYNQVNNEPLNSMSFNLYSASRVLLATSGPINNFSDLPITVSYLFSGFNNNTTYYIQAVGQTLNGMKVSTDYIDFTVAYEGTDIYSDVVLTNNCQGGYITIQSNVIAIGAESNPEQLTYPGGNSVDLTANGSYVNFNTGFDIGQDFTLKAWGKQFNINSQIIELNIIRGVNIVVNYKSDDNTNVYAELIVTQGNYIYVADSNTIVKPTNNQQVYILLRRINNIYKIQIVNRG